jgi:ubiquitin-like domain-containing CTD phosphatase 1
MDDFLTWAYKYYDLVVWSQTSWRWLEIKLTELGMISHPGYKICFVLDKTSMFKIVSCKRSGKKVEHSVKPLQIIWSKVSEWFGVLKCTILEISQKFLFLFTQVPSLE